MEVMYYIVFIAIFFIPCVFQLKFANKMLLGLAAKDQELINESLKQAKKFSRYWGVAALIFVISFAVGLLIFFGVVLSA